MRALPTVWILTATALALGVALAAEPEPAPTAGRTVYAAQRALSAPAFAPDGRRLYVLAASAVQHVVLEIPLAGGESAVLAEVGPQNWMGPQPLEDGSGLVYPVRREDTNGNGEIDLSDRGRLVFRDARTGEERFLTGAEDDALLLGVFRRGTRLAVLLRGKTTHLAACDVPSGKLVDFGAGLGLYGADPGGRNYIVGRRDAEGRVALTLHDFDGGARELTIPDEAGPPRYLRWRGGTAFLCAGGEGGRGVRIYRSGPGGEGPWQAWAGPLDLLSATAFHPFAAHVLLLERRAGGAALVAVDVRGERRELVQQGGEPRLLHEDRQRQRMLFGLVQGNDYRLLEVIAGARARLLETRWAAAGLGGVAVSPDGTQAAYVVEDLPPGERPERPLEPIEHTRRIVLRSLAR